MSALSDVIKILDAPYASINCVYINFVLTPQSQSARIRISYSQLRDRYNRHESTHNFRNVDGWEQFGADLGRNVGLRELTLIRRDEIVDVDNNISEEAIQCIEALYRGILSNEFIRDLGIDMDLFPSDGTLPTLDLQDAQFKDGLEKLRLTGDRTISMDQSVMIKSFLESTSLGALHLEGLAFESANQTDLQRIILACSKVSNLKMHFKSAHRYAPVASLLGDPRSTLSSLDLGRSIDAGGLATIAGGLAKNKTLCNLSVDNYSGDWGPMAKALCDTSTIERIVASNHTLEMIEGSSLWGKIPPLIENYLTLNSETKKGLVIRKKISLCDYFLGEYDVSTFENMDIKCLPRVLAMIGRGKIIGNAENSRKEDKINQHSAIFRMLKCIPYLCNASSKDKARQVNGDGSNYGSANKRHKVTK
eukprot:scaffold27384_cov36-Cyclotella_meneghiniana.AAC.6